jgi:hypothetical protein
MRSWGGMVQPESLLEVCDMWYNFIAYYDRNIF